MIGKMGSGQPVEIRAPTPKGPKVSQEDIDKWNAVVEKAIKLEDMIEKTDSEVDKIHTTQREI